MFCCFGWIPGYRAKKTTSEEPTTSTRYVPQIAECKSSGCDWKLKPLAPRANMTFTGEPLMEVFATVKNESG